MVDLKAFALAGVAAIALTGAAAAADLLPPPPAVEPPPPPYSADLGGWYLRGDVGVAVNNAPGFSTSPNGSAGIAGATDQTFNSSLSEAGLIDVGVGYKINNWFRTDVTAELRGGSTFQGMEVCQNCNIPAGWPTGTNSQLSDFYRANLSSYIGMLNAYADLGTWYGLTPYVGAGVGVAYNRFYGGTDNGGIVINSGTGGGQTSPTGGYFNNGSTANFAWALMAGLSFDVAQNLKLDLGYRYLNYGSFKSGSVNCLSGNGGTTFNSQCFTLSSHQLASNDFRIGLRWTLDTGAPSAPPPPDQPLIRKY